MNSEHQVADRGGKHKKFLYVIVTVAALGGLLFGYNTGVISGAILFINQVFHLSSAKEEVVVSAVLMGAVVGASISGFLADRYGRRRMILLGAAIFTIGSIGTAFSPVISLLIAGQIFVGIAIGIASFISPMYISEMAPTNIRGTMVSVNQIALTSGIVLAYIVDYIFSFSGGWRYMIGLAAIPSFILGVSMLFLPESPRWLLLKGKTNEARKVLERIGTKEEADAEIGEMTSGIEKENRGEGIKILLDPTLRGALIVGMGLALFQQFTGINTVIYYAPTIFQFAGFTTATSSLVPTIGVGIVNVLFTILANRLMDRVGRRPLLLVGVTGQFIGLVLLGLTFKLSHLGTSVGTIAILSLVIYVASFAVGLGPVFWLMISEIYPLKVRGAAMSLATVVNWGMNLIVTLTFLSLIYAIGRPATFGLYAVITAIAWFFIYFRIPETKGRTLEQIEEHLRQNRPPHELK